MRFSICCRCNAEEKTKTTGNGHTSPATTIVPIVTEQPKPKPSEPIQLDKITEVSVEDSSVTRSQVEQPASQLVASSEPTNLPNVSELSNPPAGTKINVECKTKSGKTCILPFTVVEPGHYHCSYKGKEFTIFNGKIQATDGADDDLDTQVILWNFSMELLKVQQGMLQLQKGVVMARDKPVKDIPEKIKPLPPSMTVNTGDSKSTINFTTKIGNKALNFDLIEPGHFIGSYKGKQFKVIDGELQAKDGDYNQLDKELIMDTHSQCMEAMQDGVERMEAGMAQFFPSMQTNPAPGTPIIINFTTRTGEKSSIPLTFIEPGHFRGKYDGIEFTILNGEILTDGDDDLLDKELILTNYNMAMQGMEKGLLGMRQGLFGMNAGCNAAQQSDRVPKTAFNYPSKLRALIEKSGFKSDEMARLLRKIDNIEAANTAKVGDQTDGQDMSNTPEPTLQKTTFTPNAFFYEDPKKYEQLDKDEIPPAKRADEYIISLDENVKSGNSYYFHAAKPRRVTRKELTPKEHLQIGSSDRYSLFEKECLKVHNEYRKLHGVPPLVHNEFLCQVAKEWAEHLALKNAFYHRPKNEYGENLYRNNQLYCARTAVAAWYDEIDLYDYNKPTFSTETGHFTQLVWKDTLEMGTGVAQVGENMVVCCNYHPQGNHLDKFNDEFIPRPIVKRVPKS